MTVESEAQRKRREYFEERQRNQEEHQSELCDDEYPDDLTDGMANFVQQIREEEREFFYDCNQFERRG